MIALCNPAKPLSYRSSCCSSCLLSSQSCSPRFKWAKEAKEMKTFLSTGTGHLCDWPSASALRCLIRSLCPVAGGGAAGRGGQRHNRDQNRKASNPSYRFREKCARYECLAFRHVVELPCETYRVMGGAERSLPSSTLSSPGGGWALPGHLQDSKLDTGGPNTLSWCVGLLLGFSATYNLLLRTPNFF